MHKYTSLLDGGRPRQSGFIKVTRLQVPSLRTIDPSRPSTLSIITDDIAAALGASSIFGMDHRRLLEWLAGVRIHELGEMTAEELVLNGQGGDVAALLISVMEGDLP